MAGSAQAAVVTFEEALGIVLEQARRLPKMGRARVPLLDATGRVLAERVCADRDQPAFDRSTRDGFAVRAAELQGPEGLLVAGQVRAGTVWEGSLAAGAAVEIMTGAPVPDGADAILMIEHGTRDGERLRMAEGRQLRAGDNVVRRGSEASAGEEVLSEGTTLGGAEIALAAACGCSELSVYHRAKVAIVATGDELVEVGELPAPHQIRNSNSYGLASMVASAGGEAERLAIVRDVREEIRGSIRQGRRCDLLVFSGGVSLGQYDLIEEVLAEFGAEFFFTGVSMQPGKPVVFGRLPRWGDESGENPPRYFFGLPGNPISTQVTFHCFVEPFVRALNGATPSGPRWAQATLGEDVASRPGVTRLLPCRRTGVEARLVSWHGSGDLAANARANCYAELIADREYRSGEVIRILLP